MRTLPTALGVLFLGLAWLGPLPALAEQSFAAHMALHVSVIALAAPLLAIGLAGSRIDPIRLVPDFLSPVFIPALTAVVEFFVVWAWHAPILHQAARHSHSLLILEQGSYLAVGLLAWFAAFGGDEEQRREQAPAGIAGLLMTSMHMALLGVLLALAPRPLYEHGVATAGLTNLQDQQVGGVIMLVFGGTVYLAGGLYLLAQLLRDKPSPHTKSRRGRRHATSA